MEKIIIEGKKYCELDCNGKVFNNLHFVGCTFEKCTFEKCTFLNCNFENCHFSYCPINNSFFTNFGFKNCDCENGSIENSKFISCSFCRCGFFDSPVAGNELLDCQCSGLEFTNNTQVTDNIFDGLTGNIEICDCLGAFDNTFKNMDFSGFVNSYYQSFWSCIDWVKNKFINTTVSVDAIMELAKKGKSFVHPHLLREEFHGRLFTIDMRNLSDEARFVMAANAILRLPSMEETNRVSNVEECIFSCDLHLSAVDNDNAPRIVDKIERVLKPCAIPRIDVRTHYSRTPRIQLVQVDGNIYGIDFSDSGIYEPSKQHVKK